MHRKFCSAAGGKVLIAANIIFKIALNATSDFFAVFGVGVLTGNRWQMFNFRICSLYTGTQSECIKNIVLLLEKVIMAANNHLRIDFDVTMDLFCVLSWSVGSKSLANVV
jgi:uncharacterized membrane protein